MIICVDLVKIHMNTSNNRIRYICTNLKTGIKEFIKLNVIIWSRAASNKCNMHAQEVQLKVCIKIDWITYTVEIWNTTQITLPFAIFKLFLWKENLNSDGQQLHQYQQIEQTPIIWPRHMTLEIQVLAWDRHKKVTKLNRLMGSKSSRLDLQRQFIFKQSS